MTIADPLGNTQATTLNTAGQLSSQQFYGPSSTLLRTLSYAWTSVNAGSDLATVLGSVTTTLNDTGQQSKVQYAYNAPYGVRSDVYEYDHGLALARHTVTSYLQDTAHSNLHIVNRPSRILVQDGQGNTVTRTDFAYDGTTLTSVTGAANHDDTSYGVGFTTRGNLTSTTRYSNATAGTGPVTRQFFYNSVGNLTTAQVDCCVQKVFSFSSNTQYGYPESVVRGPSGLQFTTSAAYNFDFGVVTSSTDENSQVTSYQYDNMMRLVKTFLPPFNGTSVELDTAYGDDGQFATVANYSANAGNTPKITATTDGLGHPTRSDTYDGVTLKSSTTATYDKLWRRSQVSNPFAPGETPVYTSFTYDGLSRTTQITPPSAGFTQFTFSGNSVLTTDPAGKQRKNFNDALGRLIEVDEPGYGDALAGSGSVRIDGGEASECLLDTGCTFASQYTYDSGTVSITVNAATKSVPYGRSSTVTSVAAALANAINGDSTFPVTAAVSGATVIVTARTGGASTNYSLSSSSSTNNPSVFGAPSFEGTPSGPNLTGGEDSISPDAPSINRPIRTTYNYDVLDHPTTASVAAMGPVGGVTYTGQQRSWAYDSIGRLSSSSSPESGTTANYFTDINGNPCAANSFLPCRTMDARSITRTFTYDAINRLIGVNYSDSTSTVAYNYDTGGAQGFGLTRLTNITDGTNSQTFTYNSRGNLASIDNAIESGHYIVRYQYNLADQRTGVTYPSGRIVSQSPDSIGRLSSISDSSASYLSALAYNGAQEATGFTLGNGVQAQFSYNDHLQLSTLRYFKSGATQDILNLGYDYGAANNGQIQTAHYYTSPGVEDLTKSESFSYDAWARLKTAQTLNVDAATQGTWSLQWGYDRLGNRLQQQLTGGSISVGTPTYSVDSGNRITGYSYDGAGNMTSDGVNTYAYDGANRLISINSGAVRYEYIGMLRIEKVTGSGRIIYLYAGSRPIAEYLVGGSGPLSEYVYSGSQLLAKIAGNATTYFHPDRLLSNRAETDTLGSVIRQMGHLPFGEPWYDGTPAEKWLFSTYETDIAAGETSLDYAIFRQYAPGQGRFLSADLLAGRPEFPQSLNRFAYAVNDPMNFIDPLGLACYGLQYIVVTPTKTYSPGMFVACDPVGGGSGMGGGSPYAPLQDGGADRGGGGALSPQKPNVKDQEKQINTVAGAMIVSGSVWTLAGVICAVAEPCGAIAATAGVGGAVLIAVGGLINWAFGGTGGYSASEGVPDSPM